MATAMAKINTKGILTVNRRAMTTGTIVPIGTREMDGNIALMSVTSVHRDGARGRNPVGETATYRLDRRKSTAVTFTVTRVAITTGIATTSDAS